MKNLTIKEDNNFFTATTHTELVNQTIKIFNNTHTELPPNKSVMKTLELFSGAGGLAKGLELAGFETVRLVEWNKHACVTLAHNFGSDKVFAGDIRDFNLTTLPTIDLVAGGPPCQPFSLGGKHQADQDQRDMFPYATNAIRELQPKAFLFENVKGLLRQSFAEYFEYIVLRLTFPNYKPKFGIDWQLHLQLLRKLNYQNYQGLKYRVAYQLLNAADYGVPQSRERVFLVGIRDDLNIEWQFPSPTHSYTRLLWDQWVTGTYWHNYQLTPPSIIANSTLKKTIAHLQQHYSLFPPTLQPWQTVRDAIQHLPDPRTPNKLQDHQFREGARVYQGHTGSDYDLPAKTLKAGVHGVPGGENMVRYSDDSVRYFTVHEAKLLQTFPEDFRVEGVWSEAMRQIGNAVPVLLSKQLGQTLYNRLKPTEAANHDWQEACVGVL